MKVEGPNVTEEEAERAATRRSNRRPLLGILIFVLLVGVVPLLVAIFNLLFRS